MSILTNCPGCRSSFSVGEQLVGKKVRCKKCERVFLVKEASSPSREEDEAEDEGTETRGQIQQKPRAAKRPVAPDDEAPASRPRRRREDDDLPRVPSLRRTSRGLILGLVIGGVGLFVLAGGAVVVAVLYWHSHGSGVLEQLDSDFRGSWPVPSPPPGLFGEDMLQDTVVTLHIAGVEDNSSFEAIYDKATMLADGGAGKTAATRDGNRMTVLLAPVRDPQACANKIDFGTVRRVDGRIISVMAQKVEGLPANADAVTKAVHDLKSPNFSRRLEAAKRLKKIVPNERRKEVAQALQEALANDTNHFSRQEVVEALCVWGGKESVPFLLNMLNNLEAHDVFARQAIFRALARFPDERACEPVALYLEDFPSRQDAAEALKAMGPMAEKAVLKRLQNPDNFLRQEVCKILQVIGTKESLPALQKLVAENDFFVSGAAESAMRAIKARKK